MARDLNIPAVNTNPSVFEELAQALASAIAYMRDRTNLQELQETFEHLYRRALRQPPCYYEVNELTGQCLNAGDRMAGQAAWILQNAKGLHVYGVHSQLWHEVDGAFTSPLLEQVAHALTRESRLAMEDLRHMGGDKKSIVDVVGICEGEIWIAQTIGKEKIVDSACAPTVIASKNLLPLRVFNDPVLMGQSLKTLYKSTYMMRRAFPSVRVRPMCLVQHTQGPDFELYGIEIPKDEPDRIKLTGQMLITSSLEFIDEIRENAEAMLTLSHKLDNALFAGLPPCRGGRTLGILASTASRQIKSDGLITWREGDVIRILEEDFKYKMPRDKVRHDLCDRMMGNGCMQKHDSDYALTTKGIVRYLYCLAKYTNQATDEPMDVLSGCAKHRDRILARYGCL